MFIIVISIVYLMKKRKKMSCLKSQNNVLQLIEKTTCHLIKTTCTANQGFMQDNIIASHTCFDGHMDVNC